MRMFTWLFKSKQDKQRESIGDFLKHPDKEVRGLAASLLGRLSEIETQEISESIDLLIKTGGKQ